MMTYLVIAIIVFIAVMWISSGPGTLPDFVIDILDAILDFVFDHIDYFFDKVNNILFYLICILILVGVGAYAVTWNSDQVVAEIVEKAQRPIANAFDDKELRDFEYGLIPVFPESFQKVEKTQKYENVFKAVRNSNTGNVTIYLKNQDGELEVHNLILFVPQGLNRNLEDEMKRRKVVFDTDESYAVARTYENEEKDFEVHLSSTDQFETEQ